jgi:hypothetical protein
MNVSTALSRGHPHHVLSSGEDGVGVGEDLTAEVGHNNAPTRSLQERRAEICFERFYLTGYG